MSYKKKPQIKLYKYVNSQFELQAIIDDFLEVSFQHSLYEAGDFTISINYNIPNALLFQRGMFVQFGNDPYAFGEIIKISDKVDENGKGGQLRTIIGKDARYIFKRRIIKSLNSADTWSMTNKGELCLRNLIKDQCGSNAEEKRQLPITNTIPTSANAIGNEYSVSEAYTNLYDVLVTIATQSEIGWRVKFENGLILEVYQGNDISDSVQFSTDFDSLRNGEFTDTSDNFINAVYVGGKGQGEYRDIYEGENSINNESPEGLERFECWDNQNAMTSEAEYETEALSLLSQYGQTVNVDGNGLAKSPYIFGEAYNVGDIITIGFSWKKAIAQILSVTEHWSWNRYDIEFSFGKPVNDLSRQLQLILRQIQKAKTDTVNSVKWYTMTSNVVQEKADIVYNTIGFTGAIGTGKTFTFFLDSEQTGAKKYNVYVKNLTGTGSVTLTTGVSGADNFQLNAGTYVTSIYIDEDGNVLGESIDVTDVVESKNEQPVSSGGVYNAIQDLVPVSILQSLPTDAVLHYSFDDVPDYPDGTAIYFKNKDWGTPSGWTSDNNNTTYSVTDGIAKWVTSSSANCQLSNTIANSAGKLLVINCKTSVSACIYSFIGKEGSSYKSFGSGIITEGWNKLSFLIPSTFGNKIILQFQTGSSNVSVEIAQLYIGNGSYSTPIIDNANGQYQTTQTKGFTAQQGVSGKGIYFPARESGETLFKRPAFNTNQNLSISCWAKFGADYNEESPLGLVSSGSFQTAFGLSRNYISATNKVRIGGIVQTPNQMTNISFDADKNKWVHVAFIVNANAKIALYIDGVLKSQSTQDVDNNYQYSTVLWYLNRQSILYGSESAGDKASYSIDDLLIFDRALTETEVMALYLNNANTPKYYSRADWKLDQSNTRSVKSESEEEPKEEEKKYEEPIDEEKENER